MQSAGGSEKGSSPPSDQYRVSSQAERANQQVSTHTHTATIKQQSKEYTEEERQISSKYKPNNEAQGAQGSQRVVIRWLLV